MLDHTGPLATPHQEHPARGELVRRLQQVAAERATGLANRLYAMRNQVASRDKNFGEASAVAESIDELQEAKDVWNNLRRALVRDMFSEDVAGVLNECLEQVRAEVDARGSELALIGRALNAEQRIQDPMGELRPMLHISFLLGDRTARWGIVIGNDSAFRGNRDVPGVYSKVQRTFGAVIEDLTRAERAPPNFETGTIDDSLGSGDMIWSAPGLTHGGAMAGTLGIYNVALCTVQEDLRREGTPIDTLDRLDLANLLRQGEQIGPLVAGVAEHHLLSQASSIEAEQFYITPRFIKDQVKGAIAMVRSQGQSVNRPLPGVAIQVSRRVPPRDFWPHKIYAYDDFQVVCSDQNGAYPLGPLYDTPNIVDNYAFGVKLSEDGRVSHATDLKSKITIAERLNLVSCRHGALVMPPQIQLGLPKFMTGSSNGLLGDERSNTGVADGVAYWFCAPKIDTIKLFGLDSTTLLVNGPPRREPEADRPVTAPEDAGQEGVEEAYRGTGATAAGPHPAIEGTAQAAADLWRVDEARMQILRERSVINNSIEELHGRTEDLLLRRNQIESVADREATAAAAYLAERAVYTNVRNTMEDLVHAVLVLLALSVPFAFVLERLLIGSVNVYKQIGWFTGMFAATFLLLFVTHPAFSVSKTPVIIFLGFAILVLSSMVIFIIMRKFETELKMLQGMKSTVHAADVLLV